LRATWCCDAGMLHYLVSNTEQVAATAESAR